MSLYIKIAVSAVIGADIAAILKTLETERSEEADTEEEEDV